MKQLNFDAALHGALGCCRIQKQCAVDAPDCCQGGSHHFDLVMAWTLFSLYMVHVLRPAALHNKKYTLHAVPCKLLQTGSRALYNLQTACMLVLPAGSQHCQHLVCSNTSLEGLHVPFCISLQKGHDISFTKCSVFNIALRYSLRLSGYNRPCLIS